MHLLHKYKTNGFCYSLYTPTFQNYGIRMYEMFKCFKCGKIKQEYLYELRTDNFEEYQNALQNLIKIGYQSLPEYYDVIPYEDFDFEIEKKY